MDQTLQAASERFLDSLRAKSPRTRSTYATGLRRFMRWAREEAGSDEITLDRLDDGALEGFYLALADELGPEREATIATYVAAARAFLRHCLREGSLTTLSIERAVERLHGVRAAPRYRTPRVDDALSIVVDYVKNELPALIPRRRRRGDAAALRPRSRPATGALRHGHAPRRGGAARSP